MPVEKNAAPIVGVDDFQSLNQRGEAGKTGGGGGQQRKTPVAALDLADLDPPRILAFLSHLEDRRNNSVATRNVRLAA